MHHNISVGSLVEVSTGARLFVVEQRSLKGVAVYSLSTNKDVVPNYGLNNASFLTGLEENSLKVIIAGPIDSKQYGINRGEIQSHWNDAIAVGYNNSVRFALPTLSDSNLPNWVFLNSKEVLSTPALRAQCQWIISSKEYCKMSDDGAYWRENMYCGFSGNIEYPFQGLQCERRYIKPLLNH